MSKDLPSIEDFAEKNNLPSIDDYLIEDVIQELPSVDDFIEKENTNIEDLLEEVKSELPSIEDFIDKEEEDLSEESINIFDSFDETQIVKESQENKEDIIDAIKELIADVRNDIPQIPEIKYYDDELEKLCEIIDQVRLEIPEEIERLEKNIEGVKSQIPDLSWIYEDFENVSDRIETLRERIEANINSLIEENEIKFFEDKIDKIEIRDNVRKLDEKYQKEKDDIWNELKQSSLKIWEYHKEFKDDDRKLKKQITNEYNSLKQGLEEKIKEINENSVKTDQVLLNYFEILKEEISGLPKVKYYDEDLKHVTKDIKDLYDLVETIKIGQKSLQENLLTESRQEKESIVVTPDPLTPMDQKFATLDDLANHYRIFINRIQTQLSSMGGGGETRLEFLDDIDRDSAKQNGNLLIYNGSKWVGITSTSLGSGGGGSGGEDLNSTLILGNTSSIGMSVGIVTSTGFVGNLTGNADTATYSNGSGISTYATSSGISTVSEGLTGTPDIQIGNITGIDATFSGNVSIAGTLTYEDVTNVDSIGIITARNGAIIKAGTATTALIVEGDARVVGILTIGTSSITLDGGSNQVNVGSGVTIHHTNGVQVGGNTLHSSGLTINQLNVSGIITASSFKGNLSGIAATSTYSITSGVSTNSTLLGDQIPSYYLNYNNFTNTPTLLSQFNNDVGFATVSYIDSQIGLSTAGLSSINYVNNLVSISTFSGNYNDLTNLPQIPSIVGLSSEEYVDNLVAISTFSGDYNDLTNQPFIPSIVGLASEGYVNNLVSISTFSGDYNDLSNTPTIPSDTGDLTNGAGFVTSSIIVGYATEEYVDSLVAISTFSGNYNDLTNTPSIPSIVGLASEDYVDTSIANLIDTAPSTLDTLNELAAALGDDPNFATTITNSLASKANLSGANFTGIVTASTFVGNLTGNADTSTYASSSGLSTYSNVSGIATSAEGLTGTPNVTIGTLSATTGNFSGVVTSTSYSLPDGLMSSGTQTTTTISETSIDSFSATDYRSAKYQIQITKGSEYQITEIFVVHDGSNSYQTEYATVKTGTTLSSFSSDIDTGNVRLLATPSSVDSTTFKIIRTLIEI